jgi:protease IV
MENTSSTPIPPPPSGQRPRRKSRWWIPLAVIGGLLILFIVVIGAFVGVMVSNLGEFGGGLDDDPKPVKSKTVLVVDLSAGVVEYRPPVVFNFGGDQGGISLMTVLSAIEDAKDDDHIEGILIRSVENTGMTKLTEIRNAIEDFKGSGKFVYAYLESGEREDYYLASVADSIFMPQEGILMFNAYGATGIFMKDLMGKIGVEWHVEQFEEYKSAAEPMSRTKWSEPAKQAVRAIVDQRSDMFIKAVSGARGLNEADVRAMLDRGVYVPDSLKALGLIDGFAFESALRERIAQRIDPSDTSKHPELRTKSIGAYAKRQRKDHDNNYDEDHGFAIVYASGAIQSGKNNDPFDQEGIYSRNLIADLRKAWKNDDVEGIILRIDSPGGSALASDEIWTAIREIAKDKPVYASMSDVAASGGYYIAMACDTIIASPSTITGSIGVIMAIPNLSGTMDKIGVTIDTISTGRSSAFMNTLIPFNAADKEKLRDFGSGIYTRFVQKVADSRNKEFEETRALAKGRVWTGSDAKAAGLIDIEGGLKDAVDAMKRRIGVDPKTKINLYTYPEKVDNLTAILRLFGIDRDEDDASVRSVTLNDLMVRLLAPSTPVEQLWRTVPADTRNQMKFAVAMANIGSKEPTMMMLPMGVPQF